MPRPVVRVLAVLLLLTGTAFPLWVRPSWEAPGLELALAAFTAVVVVGAPEVRRSLGRLMGRLRRLSPRAERFGAIVAVVASFAFVLGVDLLTHTPMALLWHDEHQFLLQSQLLARGRLWLPRTRWPTRSTPFTCSRGRCTRRSRSRARR